MILDVRTQAARKVGHRDASVSGNLCFYFHFFPKGLINMVFMVVAVVGSIHLSQKLFFLHYLVFEKSYIH